MRDEFRIRLQNVQKENKQARSKCYKMQAQNKLQYVSYIYPRRSGDIQHYPKHIQRKKRKDGAHRLQQEGR